jgi:uncharacterized protein (DUF433 family)
VSGYAEGKEGLAMKFNAATGTIDSENDVELIPEGHPLFGVVWINPARMSGAPCFYGTRVPIKNLFDYLKGGDSLETFLEDFEGVKREHVEDALLNLLPKTLTEISDAG